jgi:hypothetical protein
MADLKPGLHLNYDVVSEFLKKDRGGYDAIVAVATDLLHEMDDPEVKTTAYITDRAVVALLVPADKQAKNGVATRAAGRVGDRARKAVKHAKHAATRRRKPVHTAETAAPGHHRRARG